MKMKPYLLLPIFLIGTNYISGQAPEWNNIQINQVNEEPVHAWFYHYPSEQLAYSSDHNKSAWILPLNGSWQFNKVSKPSERNKEFSLPEFDASVWERIQLPLSSEEIKANSAGLWNATFPDVPENANSVNSYRKIFPIPEDWYNHQIFIRFEGVGSAAYLWMNGKRVGYTETGSLGAEFNISPYVKFGRINTLAVATYRWSDGNWIDGHDSSTLAGIYRNVYIFAIPGVAIHDFFVTENVDKQNTGHFKVEVAVKNSIPKNTEKYKILVSLKDKSGKDAFPIQIKEVNPSKKADSILTIEQQIPNVQLWNPGSPYLYTLVISLRDKENKVIDVVSAKTGFRNIEVKGSEIQVNGQSLNFDSTDIHYFNIQDILRESQYQKGFEQMKGNHVNAIYSSKIANDPYWLDFCDENGICVIDEIPFSIDPNHDIIGTGPEWKAPLMARMKKIAERDKNHPCVIQWSISTRMKGSNIDFAKTWLLQRDKSRTVK
jgi:beta-galactosidase